MSRTRLLNGNCQHCGGFIEFPAESVGLAADCPHCGQTTELLLAAPPQERTVPVKTMVYTGIAVLILVGGLVGAMIAVNRLQRTAEQRKAAANADDAQKAASPESAQLFAQAGFQISAVTLEKSPDSPRVFAVGTIRNETDRPRLGVKVEIELLDVAGKGIGVATARRQTLEPGAEWRFKAPVSRERAASARVVSIKEGQ
jgi:hypothetical protein